MREFKNKVEARDAAFAFTKMCCVSSNLKEFDDEDCYKVLIADNNGSMVKMIAQFGYPKMRPIPPKGTPVKYWTMSDGMDKPFMGYSMGVVNENRELGVVPSGGHLNDGRFGSAVGWEVLYLANHDTVEKAIDLIRDMHGVTMDMKLHHRICHFLESVGVIPRQDVENGKG